MKTITEKYMTPTLATNSLTYTAAANGTHIVTHRMHAGETANDCPEVYRFATVEEARAKWVALRQTLTTRGYVRQ